MSKLEVRGSSFVIDGQKTRILSGALHYFRVHPKLWADRLRKLRLLGLNTVETYVAWNLHEPRPGKFDFTGQLDIRAFFEEAARQGLHAILRPGPYICAEWEFGGFPAWLLEDPQMRLRCLNKPYLAAVKRYFAALMREVKPLFSDRGGPIMMVQIENEYGSYGNDHAYLRWIADTYRALGVKVPFFTSDGPCDWMLQGGTLPEVLKTVNFGSKATEAFATLERFQPGKPLMCMEFWNGWFDHWGEKHHTRTAADAAASLDEILGAGASVNLYMFHGGTNYGYNSGANCRPGFYEPTIGSYDYDSPLDEAGDPTPKYHAFREVLGKYTTLPAEPVPAPAPKKAYGKVALGARADLFASLPALGKEIWSATPDPMERFGQAHGLILYRTRVQGPLKDAPLSILGLADRAQVFLDGVFQGVLHRNDPADTKILLNIPAKGATLELLVENLGRSNYGVCLEEGKGINLGVVLYGQRFLYDWTIVPLPLTNLRKLSFTAQKKNAAPSNRPAFYRGELTIEGKPVDTFLSMMGWDKGHCWINGFHLGRHWKIGPQRTHFIPAPYLKKGRNEIVVLELDGLRAPEVEFLDHPLLDSGEENKA